MDEITYVDYYDKIGFGVITKDEISKLKEIDNISSWYLLAGHYFSIMNDHKCCYYTNKIKQLNIQESDDIVICLTIAAFYNKSFFEDFNCIEIERCQEESLKWYMKCLNNKSGFAEHYIGNKYAHGKGVSRNIDIAIEWYNKSVDKGYHMSILFLGSIYEPININLSVDLYKRAAEKGNVKAMLTLSHLYEDINICIGYLEKASNMGYIPAMFELAQEYMNYDVFQAIKWLKILYSDDIHLKETLYFLALCYEKIDYSDRQLIISYYEQAVNLGNDNAKVELAKYYRWSNVDYYLRLLDDASNNVIIACNILMKYYEQIGDFQGVIRYAIKGYNLGGPNCSYILAINYLFGTHIEKNTDKAISILENLNINDSNLLLAELYLTGDINSSGLSFKTNLNKAVYHIYKLNNESIIKLIDKYPIVENVLVAIDYPQSYNLFSDDVMTNILEIHLSCDNNLPSELQNLIVKQYILIL